MQQNTTKCNKMLENITRMRSSTNLRSAKKSKKHRRRRTEKSTEPRTPTQKPHQQTHVDSHQKRYIEHEAAIFATNTNLINIKTFNYETPEALISGGGDEAREETEESNRHGSPPFNIKTLFPGYGDKHLLRPGDTCKRRINGTRRLGTIFLLFVGSGHENARKRTLDLSHGGWVMWQGTSAKSDVESDVESDLEARIADGAREGKAAEGAYRKA